MNPLGFEEFYQQTFASVLSTAILASGSRRDAEDAVQEAYIIALRRWDEVGGYDAPDAWVRKVALRQLSRTGRKNRREAQRMLAVGVPPQATPEETAHAREVLSALAGLPAGVRIALVACTVLGWTQAEAAELLGAPRNTIANRIFRGRAMLARRLGLTGQVAGVSDPLVPSQGLSARFAVLDEDPVESSLAQTADWLREGVESEPGTAGRIWACVIDRAAAPWQPRRRKRWRFIGRGTARRDRDYLDG